MKHTACLFTLGTLAVLAVAEMSSIAQSTVPPGFVSIFNGRDLTGWKIPEGDNGHWKVVDGVIDYDAGSEAPGNKNLWTEKAYRNFELKVDWRIKAVPFISKNMKIVLPDGTNKKDDQGRDINLVAPDSDSGIMPRGHGKAQFNIWNWPVGSGEMYGYRTDPKSSPELRAAATPRTNADRNIGEWNTFEITAIGNTLRLVHNGKEVIPTITLPDLPAEGPIGLQHHGSNKNGVYGGIPALVQFRNIYVKELP
jgi:hypothetical protein